MNIWHKMDNEIQLNDEYSYIGGKPMLPVDVDIPIYARTGCQMTFFFQIEIKSTNCFNGKILSVFCTTDYVDEDIFIPKIPENLEDLNLNDDFFNDYESFFKLFLFNKSNLNLCNSYKDILSYHRLIFGGDVPDNSKLFGECFDKPRWILGDETPKSYNGDANAINFLFQTKYGYEYEKLNDAPRQKIIDYSSDTLSNVDSFSDEYSLFLSNELYFFGVGEKNVLVIPQS